VRYRENGVSKMAKAGGIYESVGENGVAAYRVARKRGIAAGSQHRRVST